jgi:hypothetical protein
MEREGLPSAGRRRKRNEKIVFVSQPFCNKSGQKAHLLHSLQCPSNHLFQEYIAYQNNPNYIFKRLNYCKVSSLTPSIQNATYLWFHCRSDYLIDKKSGPG